MKNSQRKNAIHTAKPKHKWSASVTAHSDALRLEDNIFTRSPVVIAQSLKQAAEHSQRRKTSTFRSAMSMLVFYINRAGKNLTGARRKKLETAKIQLRKIFDK